MLFKHVKECFLKGIYSVFKLNIVTRAARIKQSKSACREGLDNTAKAPTDPPVGTPRSNESA